jgi:RNase H-fold protein (predicted Holliday junction resolvase)
MSEELSKLNKKYSIATIVVAAPSTPTNRSSFTTGRRAAGIARQVALPRYEEQKKNSAKDRLPATR